MRWHKIFKTANLGKEEGLGRKAETVDDGHEEQSREMESYITKLKEQIRSPKARECVAEEMQNHIKDQAEEYERQGMEKEKAFSQAVEQMGDPVEAGVELDRIHRPRMNWPLFAIILGFSILGLILQYVCFYGLGEELLKYQPSAAVSDRQFYSQCVYTLLGLAMMTGICFLDYSRIGKYSKVLTFLFLFGIWWACTTGGVTLVNGNRSWFLLFPMRNGGFSYFKSLLYLFVPLFGGILYKSRGKGYRGIGAGFLWIAALAAVGNQVGGGQGGTIDVILVCTLMIFIAIGKGWFGKEKRIKFFGAAMFVVAIAGIMVYGNLSGYALARLQGSGYLNIRTREIAANLSLNGSSTAVLDGKHLLPWENIPLSDIQYDFIFLQMASQLGIFKMAILCAGLAGMLIALFYAVIKQKNQLGQMMGIGCVAILALETVRTIFNNLGMYVVSTNGLMFFSYGKGHTLVVYILLGVVLSVYRYKDLVWEDREERISGREKETIFKNC